MKDFWINEATIEHDICTMPVQPFVDMVRQELGNAKRVLDLGCGVGRLSHPLSKYYEITGIDINQKFLDAAPKNKRVKYLCQDYVSGNYDAAYCILLFQHILSEEKESYIKQVYKALQKGGKFLFQYVEGDYHGKACYDARIEEVKKWLKDFKIERIQFETMEKRWTWITARK